MRWIVFNGTLYILMGIMGIIGAPTMLWREDWTREWMKLYARTACRIACRMAGLKIEIRGEIPTGNMIVAAKHQSMLEVLILYNALPIPRFVMKKELLWVPVFGIFAWRSGAVPIDRRPRQGGTEHMVRAFKGKDGQLAIYPQGTRIAPGVKAPYRRGVVRLSDATGWPIQPVATNAGLFWQKGGGLHGPGTVVVEFLEPLPDLPRERIIGELERVIEAASDRLLAEAAREAQEEGL